MTRETNPEWTKEDFARARPASEVHGKAAAKQLVRKRGRPTGSSKEQIALRVDVEVLKAYKSGGAGWQTRMNDDLRKAVEARTS